MLTVLVLALTFLSGCDETTLPPEIPPTFEKPGPDSGSDLNSNPAPSSDSIPALTPYASWTGALADLNEELPAGHARPPPVLQAHDQTIRQFVHLSLGGERLRIRFSNRYGTTPVHFERVRVAISPGGTQTDDSTDTAVPFGGESSVSIPAGADIWSDDISLTVAASNRIAVSVFVRETSPTNTAHRYAGANIFITSGDATSATTLTPSHVTLVPSTFWLQEIDVLRPEPADVVVAFGDSLTDGTKATWAANHRYPDFLSAKLPAAVVNAGIAGNRWLEDGIGPGGLKRFRRDVLDVTGATHCIVLLGTNDIGFPNLHPSARTVDAGELIKAFESVVQAGNAAGMRMLLATLPPFLGSTHYSAAGEQTRQQVNAWIRAQTSRSEVAGYSVVDVDLALRDPENPVQLLPDYDSGDHLHPNDAGYRRMAELAEHALGYATED